MERLRQIFSDDWFELLKPFLLSSEFKNIAMSLKREVSSGVAITPNFADMFRAFKETPRFGTHTIIMGQDPYPGVDNGVPIADGIAFSSRTALKCPKSLQYIYDAIDQQIYNGTNFDITNTYDLTKWSKQGILLLNSSFSTTLGKAGAHVNLWHPFTKYVIEAITDDREDLGIIFMGSQAKSYIPFIKGKSHTVFECEHPMAAGYRGGKWDSKAVFARLDSYQNFKNNIKIKW